MSYVIAIQKMPSGKHRVVLYSSDNAKLILGGEPINRRIDAVNMANDIRDKWNDKREIIPVEPLEVLPPSHKWPKNSGPKSKRTEHKASEGTVLNKRRRPQPTKPVEPPERKKK